MNFENIGVYKHYIKKYIPLCQHKPITLTITTLDFRPSSNVATSNLFARCIIS